MTEMNFKTDRAKQAYDEMVEIANDGKQEVVELMREQMADGAQLQDIFYVSLNNSKIHSENMALALETACRIDREEYGMEIAIHNAYDGEKMEN